MCGQNIAVKLRARRGQIAGQELLGEKTKALVRLMMSRFNRAVESQLIELPFAI
jgi:hypothetical protein